jgi:hypothetical protein
MKIKTAEATGSALDWGLAVAVGGKDIHCDCWGVYVDDVDFSINGHMLGRTTHIDPWVCMGLIEQHGAASMRKTFSLGYFWECKALDVGSESHYIVAHGKTLAEAVARCVIAMRLGDEFEVPDELGVQS